MQVDRPCFRADLIAKPIIVAQVRLFELRDPGTGRVLRFTADGYSIAYLLNGQRSLSEVREEFLAQRGIRISDEKLRCLLEQLKLLGCLVSDPNLTVPYNALETVALPILGDGGLDEALATVVLGAEAFKDYYSIIPGVRAVADTTKPGRKAQRRAKASAASIALPMPSSVAAAKRKGRCVPPPIPFQTPRSKAAAAQRVRSEAGEDAMPILPPLPSWPPLANAMRRAREERLVQKVAVEQVVDVARRYPRAVVHGVIRKPAAVSPQALWLACGFFAAALVWASWSLTRAIL